MTDENKLQDTFAETCDKLNDAYVFCQKELNRLEEENTKLKSKLQLKETAYDFDIARLEEENAKLKKLLKIILSKTKIYWSMVFQKDIIKVELNEALLTKIDEVLK